MNLYVPCSKVNYRRYVMALPVDPGTRVMSFIDPKSAIAASKAFSQKRWTLVCDEQEYDMDPIESSEADVFAWETSPDKLAEEGLVGPNGLGLDVCEFVEPNTLKIIESMTINIEDIDETSAKACLEVIYMYS